MQLLVMFVCNKRTQLIELSAFVTIKNMRNSKYYNQIKTLLEKPSFTSKEAREKGIPTRMLDYFCKIGILERIDRGVFKAENYQVDIDVDLEELVLIAKSISGGIICLISALYYYDLTDQIMREYWIAIPNKNRAPKRKHTRIIRMRNTTLGARKIKIGEVPVKIFNRERTIIDAFRYLDKEIALKALKKYLEDKKNKPNIDKLTEYGKQLNVNINPYILAMTYE